MKKIAILGSTGSIGTQALEVVSEHPDLFEVYALTANNQVDLLINQARKYMPEVVVIANEQKYPELKEALEDLPIKVWAGSDAIAQVVQSEPIDMVLTAMVGYSGLRPTISAIKAGKAIALANKETLVVAGELIMKLAAEHKVPILPVDSEHSAIFQCLPEDPACWAERVDSILLTASGGPFRTRAPETLAQITPEQACAHPNFSMGRKISVDSATMMNKALEVIEARWLFDLAPEQIKVVIHPQQIIHSMVQFKDASILAQLGTPDMRVPIACGLAWPERIESGASRLDFAALAALTFEEADVRRFPGLHLSWQALNAPEGTTAVLNAANEVAVDAFLTGKLRFDHIHAVNLATLDAVQPSKPDSLESLLALDAAARVAAQRAAAALAL